MSLQPGPVTMLLEDATDPVNDDSKESSEEGPQVEPESRKHMGRKTIGVDYGLRRTGLCVSVGYAPRPLPLVTHDNNPAQVAAIIAERVKEEGAEQIVVGLPLNSQGGEGEQANHTRRLIGELAKASPRSWIFLWDERYSSTVAKEKLKEMGYHERDLKGSGMIDVVASIGILSDFFDKNGGGAEVAHSPAELEATPDPPRREMPTQSFKEWRKEMMQQAASSGASKRGNKEKKGR